MLPDEVLAEVLARPLDDGPRLTAARLLRQAGDPRGEYIERQCLLARRGAPRDDRLGAMKDCQRLIQQHRRTWMPWRGLRCVMRRGFVEEVDADAKPLLAAAKELFAREPVARLKVSGITPDMLAALADSGAFARVRNLALHGELDIAGARVLRGALARRAAPLAALNLGSSGLDAEAVAELVPALEGCQRLTLTGNPIEDEGLRTLAGASSVRALTTLFLAGTNIEDGGAAALAASKNLGALTHLGIARNDVTEGAVRAIVHTPAFHLRWLEYTDESDERRIVVR